MTVDLAPTIHALASDDVDAAIERIAALGAAALPALAAALDSEPPEVRRGAVEALARIDGPDATRLLARIAGGDRDVEVRYEAILALPDRNDAGLAPVVEAALADPRPKIRLAAAGACAALCTSPGSLDRLVDLVLHDEPLPNAIAARASAVRILATGEPSRAGAIRAAIATRAIPVAARRDDPDTGLRAALLASDVGDGSGRDHLAAAAAHGAPGLLRLHAVWALGHVGQGADVGVLAALDGTKGVAEYAADALTRLAARHVPGAQDALDAWAGPRPAAPLPAPPGLR